jgi:catechol 2,3-dioxygenase-like lactoylglutathione lyase family enzyme
MQPRISVITLGVADLDRAKRFYTDVLGWQQMHDANGIVMYKLNGIILSLFPQHGLAVDAQVGPDATGSRFTLAQCLRSAEDVDAFFAVLVKHKATIAKMPEKVFWGGLQRRFRRS